jgi:hypothetical protein
MGAISIVLVIAAFIYSGIVEPSLKKEYGVSGWPVKVASIVTHRAFVVILLAVCESLVRKWLWKVVHPELNFSGTWRGRTKYTNDRVTNAPVPFERDQIVVIEQDCLDLRLPPSTGRDFIFKSRTIDIQDDGVQLVYAYHVRYSANIEHHPPEAYGYEELEVVSPRENRRPLHLKGWFAHCAHGQEPVYSGEVTLKRDA